MRKIWVIAMREFGAAVKSKAFLISLVLMPVMMFGGIFVQKLTAKIGDIKTRRIAIVDHTPDAVLYDALNREAEKRNQTGIFDQTSGKQVRPKIVVEKIDPVDPSDEPLVRRQRLELSDRVRQNELFAFVEIGPDVLRPTIKPTTRVAESANRINEMNFREKMELLEDATPVSERVRYSTNRPTNVDVREFLQGTLTREVYRRRLENAGLPFMQVMPLLSPPRLLTHGLTKIGPDGQIKDATRENEVAAFMVPLALIMLMFLIVIVGASPLTTNLVEEKQLRIAEVLLGSVKPFELMMGKLLGGVGVALALATVYFAGAYFLARQAQVADMVSPALIFWFVVFTVIGTLMYGALFVAAGAAVTNVKEAQTMITPVILIVVLPLFVIESLLRDPSGIVATAASFFPTSAPMVTVARLAIPPGIPLWQTALSALIALLTTVVIVWASGRIFRVGILMQGQGAKLGQMLKWVVRG